MSPPLDQQVDLEGLSSNPWAGKLDSGFQLLRLGLKFDHLEGGDEVDPTMARKIYLCDFNFKL
jgi:hypothetical protein